MHKTTEASYHQQKMWFVDQFEKGYIYPQAPIYHNMPLIIKIQGELDLARWTQAVNRVLTSHSIFNTQFKTKNGVPFQCIEATLMLEENLFTMPESTEETAVRKKLIELRNSPFCFEGNFLVRSHLVQLSPVKHYFQIVFHHAICDRTSLSLIYEQLLLAYQHPTSDLPKPTIEFSQFSQWQYSISPETERKLLTYWKRKLTNSPPRLLLPTPQSRPLIHVYEDDSVTSVLNASLSQHIQRLSHQLKVPCKTFFLSIFTFILHKYTAQKEVVVGYYYDRKMDEQLKSIIGPVNNLIVLKNSLAENSSFLDFLIHVQKMEDEAKNYSQMPFDHLVKLLSPEKDMSTLALCDNVYHYEKADTSVQLEGLSFERTESNLGLGKFDLNLLVKDCSNYFELYFTYNARYFSRAFISGLSRHFVNIVMQVCENVHIPLCNLDMIDDKERHDLFTRLNPAPVQYPAVSITDLIDKTCQQYPANIALKYGTEEISYQILDNRARQLAQLLQQRGVRSQDIIAVLLPRSCELIAAMVAIFKLGAVYLPLDLDHPSERTNYILNDSQAKFVICNREQSLPNHEDLNKIFIDDLVFEQKILPFPSATVLPEHIAYIIYTSGTTGHPKGVVITHRNLTRLFITPLEYRQTDVWCLFHSQCFDFSVWEILGALLFGGKLIIIPKNVARDPALFCQLLVDEGVSILNQTPTAFYNLLPKLMLHPKLPHLTSIIFGGEALNVTRLKDFHDKYPSIRLINMYGITEGTIHYTYKEITSKEISERHSHIGSPLPTNRCYVLDVYKKPVPLHVKGELYIAGAGLALNYFNKPSLTNERFTPNPYDASERIYRTGDQVKINDLYELEYFGRLDHQVKLRGYRIELGEIETQMLSIEGISAVHVAFQEDARTDPYLCAYLVLKPGMTTQLARRALIEKIPDYMIPSYFVELNQLPLTSNGKIDAQRLPLPNLFQKGETENFVPPSTQNEIELAKIWGQVLKVDPIGLHDNFFAIGGNSLNAVRTISMVNAFFGSEVNLSDLFKFPTIDEFCRHTSINKVKNKKRLVKSENKEYYPVSSSQQRLFILNSFNNVGTTYNVYRVYHCQVPVDRYQFERACQSVIDRHESLRTCFEFINESPVQKILDHVEFHLTVIDTHMDIKEVAADFIQPLDLSQAPLFRVALVNCANNQQYIIINTHHIIVDGVAMAVIEEELSQLYSGSALPMPHYQYKDFSEWQNEMLSTHKLEAQREFWLKTLEGELPTLQLPLDYIRPNQMDFDGEIYRFSLDPRVYVYLQEQTRRLKCTLSMYVMAAFALFLHKYTQQNDLIIGCTTSGRTMEEVSQVVGHFLNMLPMRVKPQPDQRFSSFLEDVKNFSVAAFENQDYPFDLLVNELKIERNVSRNPVFDVAYIFQNFLGDFHYHSDISFKNIYNNQTAKHDLSLYALVEKDELIFEFEFAKSLFKIGTIQRMSRHFLNLLASIAENPEQVIKDISLMDKAEVKELIWDFNATDKSIDTQATLPSLFEAQVRLQPNSLAALSSLQAISYNELNRQANQIAHFIKASLDTSDALPSLVGVYLHKSIDGISSLLGIMKAGCAYVPIDPTYPFHRVRTIVEKCNISFLISEKRFIKNINRLQWETGCVNTLLCIDSDNFDAEEEHEKNEKMNSQLWDYVSAQAQDEISEGGWKSSYTGDAFSIKEMQEFQNNFAHKIIPYCDPSKKVLEIGIGSGLSMYKIHHLVDAYVGTDLSENIILKNRSKVTEKGIRNITLHHLAAHEMDQLEGEKFDIIIFNSVIQSFHGHNYLRQVLKKAINLAKPHAIVYLGDLLDYGLKAEFIQSLNNFKLAHANAHTKLDWESELFLSREFVLDLQNSFSEIAQIDISNKIYTLENELTKYRFDAILTLDSKQQQRVHNQSSKRRCDRSHFGKLSEKNLEKQVDPNKPAYVIFTSGTTGIPKGVTVAHRSVVNVINWVNATCQISESDRVLWTTSLCFDLSVYDIFGLFAAGGSIFLPSQQEQNEPSQLVELLLEHKITVWDSAPAALQQILPVLEKRQDLQSAALRLVLLSGDWIPVRLPQALKSCFPKCEVMALGGATEATIWSNYYPVDTVEANWKSIPYGKPIQNAKYYILDDALNPLPINVPGNLYIGGQCLALGYFQEEALTTSKFITNPFLPHERMYKTGDLARWCVDGQMEFLGRNDHQVKIRGYRIEKGEIISSIMNIPGMREAHVVVKTDQEHNKYLSAYYVADREYNCQFVKETLGQKLPPYMIPAHLIQIDKFPLNLSGKIDDKALPADCHLFGQEKPSFIKPGNALEETILQVWEEELNRNNIGMNDNFFELGGNSIKIVKLSMKLKEKLQRDFPIVVLFQYPTIKSLAEFIKREQAAIPVLKENTNLEKGKAFMKKRLLTPSQRN